jgi:uncharacterized membrane protein YhiD involved in acid resistance
MAGLRTNALVSLGAAGFVVFSTTVPGDNSPTRVAAQIVSGIGFLGAGVILREGINIQGLNTAATLWCSAMIGTFAGFGELVASVLAGAFVIGTNLFLRPVVRSIDKQPLGAVEVETQYAVELRCQDQEEAHIRALLLQAAASAGFPFLTPRRQTARRGGFSFLPLARASAFMPLTDSVIADTKREAAVAGQALWWSDNRDGVSGCCLTLRCSRPTTPRIH